MKVQKLGGTYVKQTMCSVPAILDTHSLRTDVATSDKLPTIAISMHMLAQL